MRFRLSEKQEDLKIPFPLIICTTIQGMVLHLTGMKADFFTMPLTGQRRSILRAESNWDDMVIRDMNKDVSWEKSAKQYKDLYVELTPRN